MSTEAASNTPQIIKTKKTTKQTKRKHDSTATINPSITPAQSQPVIHTQSQTVPPLRLSSTQVHQPDSISDNAFVRSTSHPPLDRPNTDPNDKANVVWPSLQSYSTLSPEEILARYAITQEAKQPKAKKAPRKSDTPSSKKPLKKSEAIPPDQSNTNDSNSAPELTSSFGITQPQSSQHPPEHNPPPVEPLNNAPCDNPGSKTIQANSTSTSSQPTKRRRTSKATAEPTSNPRPLRRRVSNLSLATPTNHTTNIDISQIEASNIADQERTKIKPIPKSRAKKAKTTPNQVVEQPQQKPISPPQPIESTTVKTKRIDKQAPQDHESPPSRPKKRARLNNPSVQLNTQKDVNGQKPPSTKRTSSINAQNVFARFPQTALENNGGPIESLPKTPALPGTKKSKSTKRSEHSPSKRNPTECVVMIPTQNVPTKTKAPAGKLDATRTTRSNNKKADTRMDGPTRNQAMSPKKPSPDITSASECESDSTCDAFALRPNSAKKAVSKSRPTQPPQEPSSAITSSKVTCSETSKERTPQRTINHVGDSAAPKPLQPVEPSPRPVNGNPVQPQTVRSPELGPATHCEKECPNPTLFQNQSEEPEQVMDYRLRLMMPDDSYASSRRSASTDQTSFLKKQKNKAKMKAKRLMKKQQHDFASEVTLTPTQPTSPFFIPNVPSPSKQVGMQFPVQALQAPNESPSNVPKHFGRWELSMPTNQHVPISILARMHQFLDEAVCAGFARPIFRDPTPTSTNLNTPALPEYPNPNFKPPFLMTTLPPIDHPTIEGNENLADPTTFKIAPIVSEKPSLGSIPTEPKAIQLPSPRKRINRSFSESSSSLSDDINDTVTMALGLEGCDDHPRRETSQNDHPQKNKTLNHRMEMLLSSPTSEVNTALSKSNLDQFCRSPSPPSDLGRCHERASAKEPTAKPKDKTERSNPNPSKNKVSSPKTKPGESDSSSEDETESSGAPTPAQNLEPVSSILTQTQKAASPAPIQTQKPVSPAPVQTQKPVSPTPIQTQKPVSPADSSSDEDTDSSSDDDDSDNSRDDSDNPIDKRPSPSRKPPSPPTTSKPDQSRPVEKKEKRGKDIITPAIKKPVRRLSVVISPSNHTSSKPTPSRSAEKNKAPPKDQVTSAKKKPESKPSVQRARSDSSSSEQAVETETAPPSGQRPTKPTANGNEESSSSSGEEKKEEVKKSKKRATSLEIGPKTTDDINNDPLVAGFRGRAPMTGRRKTLEAFKPHDFSVDTFNFPNPSNPANQKKSAVDESSDDDDSSSSDDDDDDDDEEEGGSTQTGKQSKLTKNLTNGLPAHKLAGSNSKHQLDQNSSLQNKKSKKPSLAQIWAKEESRIKNSKNKK